MSQKPLGVEIYRKSVRGQNLGAHFVFFLTDIDRRSTLTDVFVFDSLCDIKWDTIGIWMNLSI